ncbi:hypothetical protein [Limimaricola pyoseonensis]|uniref:Lipoprotein n=1 Tax=Limimaricola pyoseonensis TaxID=521013 RepID=A0A1G7KBJ4_9RHOB|nr:hypothetical protein [Limimaricola pyoseonensis]SDF34219.1 hypothetical protein SAMN04488567_0146 [Limimaricola pyoseonensis]
MKPKLILIALPVVCLAAGYGAGLVLFPAPPASADAPTETAAPEVAPLAAEDPVAAAEAAFAAQAGTETAEAAAAALKDKTERLVELGRMTVPVVKPRSVTYVIAEVALAMHDAESAARHAAPEAQLRLRDALLAALNKAAEKPVMAGAAIDTEALSELLLADLQALGLPVEDVLFPNFFKQDVARRDLPQAAPEAAPDSQETALLSN